jgi:hypothetical protein
MGIIFPLNLIPPSLEISVTPSTCLWSDLIIAIASILYYTFNAMSAYTPHTATDPPSPTDTSLATSIFSSDNNSKAPSEADRAAKWRFSTLCAAVDGKDQYGASSTPIYQTATFKGMDGQYDYTRSGNPTRTALGE